MLAAGINSLDKKKRDHLYAHGLQLLSIAIAFDNAAVYNVLLIDLACDLLKICESGAILKIFHFGTQFTAIAAT